MPRNRTIYNVLSLYAGQVTGSATGQHTGVGSIRQLTRVQSFDEDFSRNFTDVNQYGNLAAIDRIEVEAPTVSSSFSYYPTDGSNERYLGLTVTTGTQTLTSCLSGLLNKTTDEKNYFLLIADEGNDAVGYNAGAGGRSGVIGIGNAYITSYSVDGAVGDIPTASVDLEALNVRVYANATGTTNPIPAINPTNGFPVTTSFFSLPNAASNDSATQVAALQPGDITLNIDGLTGVSISDLKVQSFSLAFDLGRTPLQRLGTRFAFSREIDFPVEATLSVEAILGDLQDGNLADLICQTGTVDCSVIMRRPACGALGTPSLAYVLRGAKVGSQAISTSIGDNATFTAEYQVQIGGPQDLARGVFISGTYV
jgi:hypothetical protein